MAMPHVTQKQLIVERLKGKEGNQKIQEIKAILAEISGYKSGPYADLRKWLAEQAGSARTASKIKARDFFAVKKEAIRQFALVGLPSTGKSSLLKALSNADIKTGSYDFTTLKPQSVIVKIFGVGIQLVDLPGLIQGASEDKGKGLRVLSAARNADGLIVLHDLTKPLSGIATVFDELLGYGLVSKVRMIAANKADLPGTASAFKELKKQFPCHDIVPVSALKQKNLDEFKKAIWKHSGLIRVYCMNSKAISNETPVALPLKSTVADFAKAIHSDFISGFCHARVYGKSARFEGQKVGLSHELADGDAVELFMK